MAELQNKLVDVKDLKVFAKEKLKTELDKKVDKVVLIEDTNTLSSIVNSADNGGASINIMRGADNVTGTIETKNDGDVVVSVSATESGTNSGPRLEFTKDGAYYTVTNEVWAERKKDKNKLVVQGDLDKKLDKATADSFTTDTTKLYAVKKNGTTVTQELLNLSDVGKINLIQVNGSDLPIQTSGENRYVNITVAEGTDNGTIKVNNVDVDVHGLKEAAYLTPEATLTSTAEDKIASSKAVADFVNSSIQASAANKVSSTTTGDNFATQAALLAGPYYHAGVVYTPKKNDYAIVIADETHDNKQYRYKYNGTNWEADYAIGSTFTTAQQQAIDSTITAEKVEKYDDYEEEIDGKVSKVTGELSAKQNRVYGTDNAGNETTYAINKDPNTWTVAFRDAAGALAVATPTADSHATTKLYVDTKVPAETTAGKVLTSDGTNNNTWATPLVVKGNESDDATELLKNLKIDDKKYIVPIGTHKLTFTTAAPTGEGVKAVKGFIVDETHKYKLSSDGASKEYVDTEIAKCEKFDNKVTTLNSTSTDLQYPSAKAVLDYGIGITSSLSTSINKKQDKLPVAFLGSYLHCNAETGKLEWDMIDLSGKEDTTNKVTTIDTSSTDIQYPSAKCVYDNITTINNKYTSQTTAPTEAITDGGIHLVILDAEPTTQYAGYIYLVKEN